VLTADGFGGRFAERQTAVVCREDAMIQKTRRSFCAGVAGAALAPFLSMRRSVAQTGHDAADWPKIVEAAKKEGKVVYYAGMAPAPLERLMAGFKKLYPDITVEHSIQSSGEQLSRVQQERASNIAGADIWSTVDQNLAFFQTLAKENALLKPIGPALQQWPAKALYESAIPNVGIEPRVLAFNTALVKDGPREWLDVLKPEYRGKIGTIDSSAPAYIAFYDFIEQTTKTPDYLEKLRAQNPKLYASAITEGQALASGEIAVSVFNVPSVLTPLIAKGAPIAIAIPRPNLGTFYVAAAFGWSKRPNAALVLLDYLMSRDGQSAWHGAGDSASPLPGIKGAVEAEGVVMGDSSRLTPQFIAAYRNRFQTIFK
jgi:iron(III) transport system substrate-binding protein